MVSCGVRLPVAYVEYLDDLVNKGYAVDRSDAVRMCIYAVSKTTDKSGYAIFGSSPSFPPKKAGVPGKK